MSCQCDENSPCKLEGKCDCEKKKEEESKK
jgi:hypothetical protein